MIWILPLLVLVVFFACKPAEDKYSSPEGYDLQNMEKFNLTDRLLEISGIAFHQGNGAVVYAVQDEDGDFFRLDWGVQKQQHIQFAPKGDFEDLAISQDQVFVLKSSGTIFGFPLSTTEDLKKGAAREWKKLLPKGEYEGMYAEEASGKIYVLCKKCKIDTKNTASGYVLQYDQTKEELTLVDEFKIDLKSAAKELKSVTGALKASAFTRNPQTGEWYILSSVNKALYIATADWKIKAEHRLRPSVFIQPEGIAFDKDLNLYISNEGDEIHAGNVMKFRYLKPRG